ncbi:oligosaccharide flippase family protein [Candidatus Beckwithbacteria bacterium]|nr:oligosaccharide flippase family protein [Candidatus Beckwithbacteria bacterium]
MFARAFYTTTLKPFLSKFITIDLDYVISGSFWQIGRQVVNNLTSLVVAVLMARQLSQSAYGTYNYLMSVLGIVVLASLPGMNAAVTQASAKKEPNILLPAFWDKVKWSLLGSLATLALAIYYYFQNQPELVFGLLVMALFFPIHFSPQLYEAFLHGKKRFKTTAIYESIFNIILCLLFVITLQISSNPIIFFAIYVITQSVLKLFFLYKTYQQFPAKDKTRPKTMIVYGRHLSVLNAVSIISSQIDRILLFTFLGPAQLAIYSLGILPLEKVLLVFSNITALALPKFAEKTLGQIKLSLPRRIVELMVVGAFSVIVYWLLAPPFFKIFFPKYISSITISQLSMLALIFRLPALLLQAFGQAKVTLFPKNFLYATSVIPQIFFILILYAAIFYFGLLGAIWARVLIAAIVLVVGLFNWNYLIRIRSDNSL